MIVLQYGLIATRAVKDIACWRLWHHRVTWRHHGSHHSIAPGYFRVGSQLESIRYLQQFPRYLALNVMRWWRHNWRHVVWINNLCGPSRHTI